MSDSLRELKEAAETKLKPHFSALNEIEKDADRIKCWRILFPCYESLDIVFGSLRDCQRVIDEMAKRGVVDDETFDALEFDQDFLDECIAEALPW